jgi:signal transduction histidine kinase
MGKINFLKPLYICLVILILPNQSFSQSNAYNSIDSLLNILKVSHDTNKINIYKELSWKLRNNNPSSAYKYAYDALQLAVKYNYEDQEASIYNYLGVIRRNQNEYSKALGYFFKALTIGEEIKNLTEIGYAYNNIGDIYSRQKNDSLALIHFQKAFDIFDETNNKRGQAYVFNQMSLVYIDQEKFKEAIFYINKTIEIRQEINDLVGLAVCYRNLGDVYMVQLDYEKANEYYNQSLVIDRRINAKLGIAYTYNHIGKLLIQMKQYEKAIPYLDSALILGELINSLHVQNIASDGLGFANSKINNFQKAYHYTDLHKNLNDSIKTLESSSRITQLTMLYDFEKQQEETDRKNKIELKKQQQIRNVLILGISITFVIIFLILRNFIIVKKSRKVLQDKNQLIEEQKEELMQKNAQLTETDKLIRQANATKDKFFSIIAHDLKSPFSSIFGFSNLLYSEFESFDEKSKKEYLLNISNVSENAYKLLQNLLEWARSQTGQIDYQPEEINIGLLINDNITLLTSLADKKGISLENKVSFQTYAFGDTNMINTVIRNLISNAIKFSYKSGIITVTAEEDGDFLKIQVSDTGIGLTEEESRDVFSIDVKFKKEGTENEKGTGLGLILSREFVEKNGGKIWVESMVNKGSKFFFTLPIYGPSFKKRTTK